MDSTYHIATCAMKTVLDKHFHASIPLKDMVVLGIREISGICADAQLITGTVYYDENNYFFSASFFSDEKKDNSSIRLVVDKLERNESTEEIDL